ncbi:MAG TPA: V-type ATP synthase subunit F [Gemmatimonadales bacterium]|jgi:vacuolar-type H+-ATPase subunit F/Vma7
MSHTARVLCQPELAAGFELAGLKVDEASSPEQAAGRLRGLLSGEEIGVLLIDERLHRRLPEELSRELARRPLPLIVPFVGPSWTEGRDPDAYVLELLRQAIGYRVRLK